MYNLNDNLYVSANSAIANKARGRRVLTFSVVCVVITLVGLVAGYGKYSSWQLSRVTNSFGSKLFTDKVGETYGLTSKDYQQTFDKNFHEATLRVGNAESTKVRFTNPGQFVLGNSTAVEGVSTSIINQKETEARVKLELKRNLLSWRIDSVYYDYKTDEDAQNVREATFQDFKKQGIEIRDMTEQEKQALLSGS